MLFKVREQVLIILFGNNYLKVVFTNDQLPLSLQTKYAFKLNLKAYKVLKMNFIA